MKAFDKVDRRYDGIPQVCVIGLIIIIVRVIVMYNNQTYMYMLMVQTVQKVFNDKKPQGLQEQQDLCMNDLKV